MTLETYLRQAARRFGRSNPERMECEHWVEMVRSGESAYAAAHRYVGDAALQAAYDRGEPAWCFDRFGMTRTRLPDGRVVCVAGEHDDHYDPDFCIFNDVVIIHRDSQIAIYGYPPEVFPPTDFHTATRHGDWIILIGSLGYGDKRELGRTPVSRSTRRASRSTRSRRTGRRRGGSMTTRRDSMPTQGRSG